MDEWHGAATAALPGKGGLSVLLFVIYKKELTLITTESPGKPKSPLANAGDLDSIPQSERSPGEGTGYLLQYFHWRIPWTEKPGGLQSTGPQRVGHDD